MPQLCYPLPVPVAMLNRLVSRLESPPLGEMKCSRHRKLKRAAMENSGVFCRCGKVVRRHTNSVDLATTVCGACGGKLDFLGRFNKDGTPAAKRAPTQYSMFVKENYGAVKEQHPPGELEI